STTFPINAVDDTTLDGTQIVTLTAQQTGYINGAQTMFVQDHETLTISIVPDNFAENDGGAVATATVTRSNVSDLDAHVISITNGDDSEVAVPLTVVIPENQFSTTFDVNAVDDTTLDGTQTVSITASSVGFISGSDSVTVDDHETLEVTISRPAVSESDGAGAANVTIRRSNITDLSQPLVVTLVNSAPDEISIPASLTLAVGDSVGSFLLNAVDDFILDGTQIASITAQATGFVDGASSVDVLDHEILVVSLDDLEVDEDAGPAATQGTVSRSNTGNLASPLTVTITSSDTTEAQPAVAIVTIPANETDGAFTIDAIDDALLDGTQTVMIDAISPGFFSQPASLDVVDAEQLTLSIDMTSIAENAGPNAAVGTLTRSDVDTNVAVSVTLLHDDPSEVDTQTVFTIPGDQSSIQFPIHAVDDDLLDGTQTVNFAVSSFGFLGDAATLDVTDFETLSVVIDEDSIGENGGTSSATVTRSNTDNAAPLLVTIGDDDPSELSHPATVTIPANEASAAFTLTGVDDALLDGTQTVTVTGSASGYEVVSDTIDVTDHETLTLTLADSAISENGGVTTATVTRSNTDIASPLLVSIVNPDATEISTASTVTIPATELSADFTVNAVDDTIFDGTVPVTLTVDALGYAPGQATIDVTDHELLTLTIADASISENGGSTTATVKRHNTDIGLPLTVFLNANPSDEVSIPATIEIPALQDEFTFDIDAFDDDVLDGDIGVEIRASAASYVDGVDNVVVTDFERLTVSALQTSTTENAGANALTLTVSRFNNDIVGDLIVTLRSDDTTEATTPASVKIPDGQQSATFTIDAVDDSLLDGVQKVPIVASGGAYGDGTLIISVWDFESLIVDVAATSILESDGPQATVATVSRSNTDVSSDLTISLFNNDPSEATTPLIVVIPAGRQSITFDVGAVQDSIDDGTQTVRLDAAQIDYQPGMDTFDVVDVTDVPNKWTNPANPFDVDNRNGVTIADLLVLVDAFNSRGPGPLPAPNGPDVPPPFVDVNCDLKLSASDLLVLATHLNDLLNGGGEGEGEGLGALHTTQQLVGIPASSLDSAPLENRLRQSQSSSRQSDNTVDLLFATGGDDSTTGARSFLRGEASDDDSLDQVIGDIADDVANDWLS
ncbi:MAG: hypothetical protein QF805_03875, partial [Pirellulaceae bacterium]|nr:hypothetical protein [Pirellulaceae bacterium]